MLFLKPAFIASFFVAVCLISTSNLSAQKLDSATVSKLPELQQQEVYKLIEKAKRTKSAALFTLLTGVSMFITGSVIEIIVETKDYNRDNYQKNKIGIALMVTGGLGIVSSPFVLAQANILRSRARAIITLNNATSLYPLPNSYRFAIPAKNLGVGIVIPLGK